MPDPPKGVLGTEPDLREDFVADVIADLTEGKNSQANVRGAVELRSFFDDPDTPFLHALVQKDGTVRLVNRLDEQCLASFESAEGGVSFLKLRPEPITGDNIRKNVQVCSMPGSPLDSLYHSLHSVYAPVLLRSAASQARLSGKGQTLIVELDTLLATAVRGGSGSAKGNAADLESTGGITTPTDEFQFWATYSGRSVDREALRAINNAFEPIRAGFATPDSLQTSEMEELVEATHTALDDIWKVERGGGGGGGNDRGGGGAVYPQVRMEHLMDTVGAALCRTLQKRLAASDLWTGPFSDVGAKLAAAAAVLERWNHAVEQLTTTFWPRYMGHPWEGDGHTDAFTAGVKRRFEEILQIRTTHDELNRLLPAVDAVRLSGSAQFAGLEALSPLRFNPYTQPDWVAAVAAFERGLASVDAAAAAALRGVAAGLVGCPLLLLRDLQKSSGVLKRPGVRAALLGEREALLRELTDLVAEFDAEAEESGGGSHGGGRRGEEGSSGGATLATVEAIVRSRQLAMRAQQVAAAAASLLQDLPGFRQFQEAVESLGLRLRRQEAVLSAEWQEEVEDSLRAKGGFMQGKLMEINSEGVLVVNYSERLVKLLRESRQLAELGHTVPANIAKVVADAERFYRYGVMLKKVANFYNNMDYQIIPEQRPMLLDSLLAFEAVVTHSSLTRGGGGGGGGGGNGGGMVSWSNPVECENYVERLQQAVDVLSLENRRLRKVHASLGVQVCGLMNVDLLRQRDLWKAKWAAIKEQVDNLAATYPVDRMKRWLIYWDHQIYKALEAGYQMGLESLSENLGELKAELAFAAQALQLRPPAEELRSAYYREMKRFVAVPSAFEGLAAAALYKTMPARNVGALARVYEKAEELFQRLQALQERYSEWVALGMVDLEEYVKNVADVAEYDVNFRALKAKRKDAERLPEVAKLDCITVSLAPLKSAVHEQLQQLHDTLLLSLRSRVLADFRTVDGFLQDSMERLGHRPKTVADIILAKCKWKTIEDKKEAIKALSGECLERKELLLQHAPGSVVDTTEVSHRLSGLEGEGGRWDEFTIALEAFGELLEKQKESLQGVIEGDIMALNQAVDKFEQRWHALKPQDMQTWEPGEVEKVFAALEDWKQQFEDFKTKTDELKEHCVAFGMAPPRFGGIAGIESDIAATAAGWALYKDYSAELAAMAAQDWIGFRVNFYSLQDLASRWSDRVKAKLAEGPGLTAVTERIHDQTEKVKRAMPALKYCRGDAFKEEHWSALLQGKLGLKREVRLENLTVGHFLSALPQLMDPTLVQYVKELAARAQGEVTIREALQELVAWSQTYELKLVEHEEGGRRTPVIKEWKDLFVELGDKQSLLASLKESQFFKAFEDRGRTYETKMSMLEMTLQTLNQIQRKWLYLEPIFAKGALPGEQGRFRRVDEEFRDVMGKVEHDPKLFLLADEHVFPGLSESLGASLDQLERCQKALAEFLEEKRGAMPRFYFIGDDDLLEILGQARNPAVIQAHLKQLFQGIHRVDFGPAAARSGAASDAASGAVESIVAMTSSAGEVVPLESAVVVTDRVDEWLEALAGEMKGSLAARLGRCLREPPDYEKYSSQVMCIAEQIKFCDHVEAALSRGDVGSLLPPLKALLEEYTSYDLSSQPLLQLKIKALVLDLIHNMDVVRQLQAAGAQGVKDWAWQKQLRYYVSKGGGCQIRMSNAQFEYSYEYQGNAPKLVHTPLTDRCYLTLTQGMHMGFGGNPYGPAGTGKTESVKALGQAFGRQVLVFNCDEGIDFQSMGRIFIGLVKCGAWGCFDEFNRLKEDQLSAVSQQIQVIQDAIKAKQPTLRLFNRPIDVDFNAGIFVTLNPAGKDYGGRSKLPDNLKALFRPVAMGQPDNELIAEVILYSEGFGEARDLASKVVSLFTLSRQLLSRQRHYDWGLRALKAALNTGGKLIQAAKRASGGASLGADREREVLINAVRVNTLSKLTHADAGKFLALLGDVFPGAKSADLRGEELEAAIRRVMAAKPFELEANEAQVRKMLQLKEALDQRMGCVVVGPSGSGKTTLWSVLRQALILCGTRVVTHVMNPKSMPRPRLLGHMDLDTREWTDGVLTNAARRAVHEPAEVRTWIVCDGDVDPEWIESLNSVLDDNHLLTLPNGERISFGSNVNFLFETHELRFASPATVSRMGMVFISEEDLEPKHLIAKWLRAQPPDCRTSLSTWADELFYRAVESAVSYDPIVATTIAGTVGNGLSQLRGADSKAEFALGLIRGLGGNLSASDRNTFARDVFNWAGERPPNPNAPLDCGYERGGLVSFVTKRDAGGVGGGGRGEALQDGDGGHVVQTVWVQRTLAAMRPWIESGESFILVGPEGCGKDMVIRHAFGGGGTGGFSGAGAGSGGGGAGGGGSGGGARKVGMAVLHCSAQTTAEHVMSKIVQSCALFGTPEGRTYRPKDCDRLVLYLKDLNLPKPDKYDSCMLVAFLQQLLMHGGFYDASLEFLRLERVQIVASMNAATTVGRHPLSTRFTASVRVLAVDYPEAAELAAIYDVFLESAFTSRRNGGGLDPRWEQPPEREKLARMMVDLYEQVKSRFSMDEHYLFTPRDLTAWVRGLLRYDLGADDVLDSMAHEAQRLFRDRLVDSDSVARFDSMLGNQLRTAWRHGGSADLASGAVIFSTLGDGVRHHGGGGGGGSSGGSGGRTGSGCNGGESKDGDGGGSGDDAVLLRRVPAAKLRESLSQGLAYYEREERELRLLLSDEALGHVARIDRVLSMPRGHLLLVGRAGVGRRQATALTTYMQGYRFATPLVGSGYGVPGFRTDLKAAMAAAGVEGVPLVLYIEEHHIVDEAVLETVNSLLSSGEVPGLYTAEELEPLLAPLRESMLEEGRHRTMYDFFVSRVQRNLHVALAMDPTHPKFLVRCESNPALTQRCTCLWLGQWSAHTMRQVPGMVEGVQDMLDGKDGEGAAAHAKAGKSGDGGGGRSGRRGSEGKRGGGGGKSSSARKEEGGGGGGGPEVFGEELIEIVVAIHESVGRRSTAEDDSEQSGGGNNGGGGSGSSSGTGGGGGNGATPLEYVAFLRTWRTLHEAKKRELTEQLRHLSRGLSKLSEATGTVDDLSKSAVQKQRELRAAQVAADGAMDQITTALSEASVRRGEVEGLKKELAVNERAMQSRKSDIETELAEIQPILDEAKQAVGQIKSDHLNEIRSLKMPPEPIADVLGAVLMLLGIHDTSWLSMKKFLGNRGVKEEILSFDAHRIDPDMRTQVSKVLKQKAASFDHATIYRVSVAAAPMAAWVKAQIRYSTVLEKIQPLEEELREAVGVLDKSQQRLSQCEDELAVIDKRVADLKQEFSRRTREAETLSAGLERAQTTLDKAQALVGQLAGEQGRWQAQAAELARGLLTLPRHTLLAAAVATYLAAAPEARRERLVAAWSRLAGLMLGSFSMRRLLSSERQLLAWKGQGLPTDQLSQENALVVAHSGERVPFVADPGGAATAWLRHFLAGDASRPLEEVSVGDGRFQGRVELAVRFGKTLLVMDADGLEPMLYPLARRDLALQGPRYVVQVGDKMVDFNENFRMVVVTRNPRPDLSPVAAALVVEVNFTVTRSGLEGQLLGVTIQHEQPKLEEAKSEMLREEEEFKVQLSQLEEQLLEALATAEGDLLENSTLMGSLALTKSKAAEIQAALDKSARASEEMDRQREAYLPFARSGSSLFFLVQQLQVINNMYQFSLNSFVLVFRAALADPAGTEDSYTGGKSAAAGDAGALDARLKKLEPVLVTRVLHWVGRAVFKADRPMLAMHFVRGMNPHLFEAREWEIFTGQLVALGGDGMAGNGVSADGGTGSGGGGGGGGRRVGLPPWASSERAAAFALLSEHLPKLVGRLDLENASLWQRWAASSECERDFPAPTIKVATSFHRLLVVQALRPDRLQSAIQQFACEILRVSSLSPPALSLAALAAGSDASGGGGGRGGGGLEPILLVTTAGADPGKELEDAAAETVGRDRYHELAMGGGQQEPAIAMLRSAAQTGDWLCLKNLHLVVAWLPTLDKELAALAPNAAPGFRLWLTTEEHGEFPAILLQQSLKVTFESPPGLKKNLQRTFGAWGRELVEGSGSGGGGGGGKGGGSLRARLLFVLAWFHAVMQERRTFIPQGWTKFYEFSLGDLRAGTMVLLEACQSGAVNWETIHGLMRDAIYGGRIDNPQDMRVLSAYLRRQFNHNVIGGGSSSGSNSGGNDGYGGRQGSIARGVHLPDGDSYADFMQVVASLPDADSPAVFGLPDNIERSVQRTASAGVIVQLRRLGVGRLDAQKYDRELWRAALGPVIELWERLSAADPNAKKAARRSSADQSGTDPTVAFAVMEVANAAEICAQVGASLLAIKRVVYGTALLTAAVAAEGTALVAGMVPATWAHSWQGPEAPQAWLGALMRKRTALGRWAAAAAGGRLLDSPVCLSDLFHPNTFLNAVRQQTARASGCAMDMLRLTSTWEVGRRPKGAALSVAVEGLQLQGAAFLGGALQEPSPGDPELVNVPALTLAYVPTDAGRTAGAKGSRGPHADSDDGAVKVPLYTSTDRETLLAEVSMPAPDGEDKWILAGVALFLKE